MSLRSKDSKDRKTGRYHQGLRIGWYKDKWKALLGLSLLKWGWKIKNSQKRAHRFRSGMHNYELKGSLKLRIREEFI